MSNRYSSPYTERFNKISQKLSQIPLNQENSRANRIDQFQQKVYFLDERFNNTIETYNKKISNLKEEIFRLQKVVEDNSKSYEFQLESRNKEINNLDLKLSQKLEYEILSRRESESKQIRYLEEKVNFLRADISTETRIRTELLNQLNSTLESDLPKLYEIVKSEGAEREECDNLTLKKTAEEIKKLNDIISIQKRNREDSEASIFEMLKDLVNRVKQEIDQEKNEREQSQDVLVKLLEDAANKLCATAQV
ncbi:hypothetical protein IMG5_192870 [Ichthyophthirius multifiliis]|uniref:Uncharacterized protein n=1 Tax=Ichthyophthirius multifiliis TaxID=5932 RepID=G0R4I1_ICHMU|nr:hypothetical protein IMG5_192870 [Ichthyophthirius multifiliis]EGR27632.1 hypothetical protein IMG5_192870 [Ichthyophthirius multifiliis]|eukprot:XP_004025084.1 hypothetical protein IMG5_192870 [Ichthyophthirius multifiliis]